MKKLISIIVVGLFGTLANAASFNWNAQNLLPPTALGSDVTMTLEGLTVNLYCDAISTSSLANTSIVYIPVEGYGNTISGAKFEVTSNIDGATISDGDVYKFYFTVVATDSAGTEWTYTSADAEGVVSKNGDAPINFGDVSATGTWTKTSNVPEPTSGLLLLCGLAGLALRRKKA